MISSKSGSFLKLLASRFHHGCLETFRTAIDSGLLFRNSRSRMVTRRSNFIPLDCIVLPLCTKGYIECEREEKPQRGVGGITKGQVVTYTLSDGKKIQKVTEVVTGTGSAVRAMSFHHR